MTATAPKPGKRLAIFLDGTWNRISNNTNVWRMKSLCAREDANGVPQFAYYDIGVNGIVGGTFGRGLSRNIIEAYKWLIEMYAPGDEVFIFGFSRGAYTARSLAGLIAICGLPKLGAPLGIDQIYDRYKHEDNRTIYKLHDLQKRGELDETQCPLEERWMLKYCNPVPIKMVGVWDTVGKIGVPFANIRNFSSEAFGFLHTGLRQSMVHCFHALAIDEHRAAFPPTLWTVRQPHDSEKKPKMRPLVRAEQRWFIGAHGNVGGGYPSDVLAQVPLLWLVRKAEGLGLAFREVEVDGDLSSAQVRDSHGDFMKGFYKIISPFRRHRAIDGCPEIDKRGTHLPVNETIDATVFEHWRNNSYKPKSVTNWAAAKKIDPATITTSVSASDPSVAVPD